MSGSEQLAGPAPQPSKQDPETFVLRGRPRPVIRFRKGLVIGLSGTVSAALIALAWASLEPPSFRFAAAGEPGGLAERGGAEAVANAPAAYSDIPRLGPPLPGDLGRPIVERQRELAAGAGIGDAGGLGLEKERVAGERERGQEEEHSARGSSVLVQLSKAAAPDSPAGGTEAGAVPQASQRGAVPLGASQQNKEEFARSSPGEADPHSLTGPVSPWSLAAGTVIPASLVTGLNSDLPGTVLAQVTENVRDSATGGTILIPQGARLVGSYDSSVSFGQKRVLLVWQRILFPDGSSIGLDNMPATDAAGYAGIEDGVDFHEWRLLKGVALSTLLGVGSELGPGGDDRSLAQALREAAQRDGSRAGEQIVARNLDVQPTLTVRPGWPVRALVRKDLILRPWKG